MKALIVNENLIAQVEQDENIFEVAPEWQWISCPEECTPEWTYDGNEFHEPVIITPKPSKAELLAAITVTTQSGKTFDGNETARTDILSALTTGELIGATSTNWKLADNTVALVTRDELLEALSLAIQEKGRIVGAID